MQVDMKELKRKMDQLTNECNLQKAASKAMEKRYKFVQTSIDEMNKDKVSMYEFQTKHS